MGKSIQVSLFLQGIDNVIRDELRQLETLNTLKSVFMRLYKSSVLGQGQKTRQRISYTATYATKPLTKKYPAIWQWSLSLDKLDIPAALENVLEYLRAAQKRDNTVSSEALRKEVASSIYGEDKKNQEVIILSWTSVIIIDKQL